MLDKLEQELKDCAIKQDFDEFIEKIDCIKEELEELRRNALKEYQTL
jgi:hypothetical protein